MLLILPVNKRVLMKAKYDRIGKNYNYTRKADPYLTERLCQLLEPKPEGQYLDIGCGTGNYTLELMKRGFSFIGIDPSEKMLKVARTRYPSGDWRLGFADRTGLETGSIDGAIGTLTIHHWPDLGAGFKELHRVLRPDARFVLFTATPQQMEGYWLNHYFPKMLKESMQQMPSWESVETAMTKAGFKITATEPYEIQPDLQDLFLYSGKHNPELYFEPSVRNGISSFAALANRTEVEAGLSALRRDIDNGSFRGADDNRGQANKNKTGDYLHVIAVAQ
jgi:ubiquinone/menaquinone biosynthesis C-methylase UbiE